MSYCTQMHPVSVVQEAQASFPGGIFVSFFEVWVCRDHAFRVTPSSVAVSALGSTCGFYSCVRVVTTTVALCQVPSPWSKLAPHFPWKTWCLEMEGGGKREESRWKQIRAWTRWRSFSETGQEGSWVPVWMSPFLPPLPLLSSAGSFLPPPLFLISGISWPASLL